VKVNGEIQGVNRKKLSVIGLIFASKSDKAITFANGYEEVAAQGIVAGINTAKLF
jgi:tRNA U34 5-carboxymethylaminomethyl modifying enzyme MnmG/GidA